MKVNNIAHDVEMLKIRTSPLEERKTTPMNATENIRMLAKLKERWAREKEEEDRIKSLPIETTIATIQVVEDLKTLSTHHIPSQSNGPINGDANTSTVEQETPMNLETPKQVSLDGMTTTCLMVVSLILIVVLFLKLLVSCKEWLKTPTLAH